MTRPRRIRWHDGWLELDAGPRPAAEPAPVSLTLETGPGCALACGYCYARARRAGDGVPADAAIADAARRVAEHARQEGRPMLLGLHGAGEPLRELAWVERATATVREQAARVGVSLRIAATTSGVVADAARRWLVENVSTLTVSWDGPREIHDRQRPGRDGRGTYDAVMDTIRGYASASRGRLRLRSTLLASSHRAVPDAVVALDESLPTPGAPRVFHLEPRFAAVRGGGAPPDAPNPEAFTRSFLDVLVALGSRRAVVETAQTRPRFEHGRHCLVWQDNLALRSDGSIGACFADDALTIGAWSPATGCRLDAARIEELSRLTSSSDPACERCFLARCCARYCPDECPLVRPFARDPVRCARNRRLGAALLARQARGRLTREDADYVLAHIADVPDREATSSEATTPGAGP